MMLGLLDDVMDVLLLSGIAFEGRAHRSAWRRRARHRDRISATTTLGGAARWKASHIAFPMRLPPPVTNHDFAGHLHGRSSRLL